jgi:5,10-methylenetetrahydromethanopterin reductase
VTETPPAVGVRWDPRWPPERVPEVARTVEQLGYDELWLVEDCFSSGGLTMAGVALAATEYLTVGVGLLPAAVRNAAIAAMEIAALAGVFPGRFVPAFGHGVEDWMLQIDARPSNRLIALEETVSAVRRLNRGETLSFDGGHVHLREVELEHPPSIAPPILVGTTGPRGLAVAGRVADGIVIPEVACPAAVKWARGEADQGSGPGRVVVYCYLSLDDDAAGAIAAAQLLVKRWIASGVFPDMAEQAGVGRDGEGPMGNELLQSIAAAGDGPTAARTVQGLWDAGADSVVLLPRPEDPEGQLRRFADECLHRLQPAA